MTNKVRGEVTLTLAGEAVTLRPTWDAIVATEAAWDCGWPEIVRRLELQRFRLPELAALILEGIKAAGPQKYAEPTLKQVGELLIAHGALQDDVVEALVTYVMGPLHDFDKAARDDPDAGKTKAGTVPSA